MKPNARVFTIIRVDYVAFIDTWHVNSLNWQRISDIYFSWLRILYWQVRSMW